MDSVAAELAVLLAVIYLLDCFRWVARSARLLRQLPFLGANFERPLRVASQFPRALAFGFPLPIETLLPLEGTCLRPLPDGLWVADGDCSTWSRPGPSSTIVPWKRVSKLRVRGLELSGAGVHHDFGSRRAALAVEQQLAAFTKATARGKTQRERAFDEVFADAWSSTALDERLAQWRRTRRPLRIATTLLLLSLAGVLWALLQPHFAWWRLLPVTLVLWVMCAVTMVWAVRRTLPVVVRPSRLQWVTLLVSPLSLIRAADLIEGELLTDFEPMLVAATLLRPAAAQTILAQALRAVRYPLSVGDGPFIDDEACRLALVSKLEALAKKHGFVAEAVPAGRHCPRCLTSYRAGPTACSSCHGVALVGEA